MLPSNGWQVTLYIFMALQTMAIVARLWVKFRILKDFRLEDYAILIAYFISLVFDIILADLYYQNGGNSNVERSNFIVVAYMSYIDEIIYPIATLSVKVALGLMLGRIFQRTWQSKAIYGVLGIYTFISLGYFFYILFYCGVPSHWLKGVLLGTCKGRVAIYPTTYIHSVATILIDLLYVVLPWLYINSNAQMDFRTKCFVSAILALGSVGVIFTIARIPFLRNIAHPASSNWFEADQSTAVMSAIEIAIGIICFSLTACKPLFKSFFQLATSYTRALGSNSRSQTGTASGKGTMNKSVDIEKSAAVNEQSLSGPSDSEGDLSSATSASEVNGLSVGQMLQHDSQQAKEERQESSAAAQDEDSTDLDNGRRHSRIRNWDMKFYNIFNKKDHPIPPTTVGSRLSPVSSRDFQQYGVQPTFQATLPAVGDSPVDGDNTALAEDVPGHNSEQDQARAPKPTLNVLTTRNLPGSAYGRKAVQSPGVKTPLSAINHVRSPVDPGTAATDSGTRLQGYY